MAKIKLKPLDDRIVIEQHDAEEKSTGGIVLPDTAKEKPTRGTVVAVGPGKMMDSGNRGKMSVRTGDEVFFGKYSGTEVEITRTKYTVLRETDVLAIIEK